MWHYGIVEHEEDGTTWYGLHEVYDDPKSFTEDPYVEGDSVLDIIHQLKDMLKDVDTYPILKAKNFYNLKEHKGPLG